MPLFSRRRGRHGESLPRPSGPLVPSADSLIALSHDFLECSHGVAALEGDGSAILLDAAGAALLQALKQPCAPEDLEERLRDQGWDEDDLRGAPAILDSLEGRGLVRRLGGLVDAARAEAAADTRGTASGPGLGLLAIPTKDRPETLARALAAWGAALGKQEATPPAIMVADDSADEAGAARAAVEAFAGRRRGEAYFLDGAARRRLAEALAPTGGRSAAFALGLDGGIEGIGRYGAVRNLILLASAGRAVAMADDDMLPDFRLHPSATDGLALSSEPDPTIVRPFTDRQELEAWLSPALGEAEAPHRLLLGRPLRDILLGAEKLDLSRADAAALESGLGPGSRVAALCFGTWGDSGIPANRYLLGLRGLVDPSQPDVYDTENYEAAMGGRIIFRSPLRTTIGGKTFMGGHVALDARSLIPPFGPWGRDEDGLWGLCLGLLHTNLFVAYPAQAVLHEPPSARSSSREEALRWDYCLNEILRSILLLLASRHESGEAAYGSLGRRLAGLASGARKELRPALAESVARSIAARIGLLERVLEEYGGEPAAWAGDVETAIAALVARLQEKRFWLPREFDGRGGEASEGALAEYLLRFGELLQAWPAMFESAVALGPELLERARVGGR